MAELYFSELRDQVAKAHGSSDEKLFEFTIKQAEQFVENRAVDKMIEAFESQKENIQIEANKEELKNEE